MDDNDFEGTLVLEQLAAIDKVESTTSSTRSTPTTFRGRSR